MYKGTERIRLHQVCSIFQKILRKDGITVTEEQAKIILDFLYEMATIVVDQYLSEQANFRKFTG